MASDLEWMDKVMERKAYVDGFWTGFYIGLPTGTVITAVLFMVWLFN